MRATVETMLREIQDTTVCLLQDIDDAEPREAEMMRDDASRLNGIAFVLGRLICHDSSKQAYELISGDPDKYGNVLGLTA